MLQMKTVLLLLSTDQFSVPLIRYLALEGKRYGWKTCIGSMFGDSYVKRIKEEKFSSDLIFISITDYRQCDHAIRKVDLVLGMIPDVMLLQVADSCIAHGKDLIAPSRLNRQMVSKKSQAEENDVLLLLECGFSPGLDHVTAKKAIDNIHLRGGKISSFKTYSGSQIAENYGDNPWQFKLTESVPELINMGKGNNRHLIHDQLQQIPYHQLLGRSKPITVKGLEGMVAIPEGDSLYYRKIYELTEASTVMKGKLARKGFERIWDLIIKLGLTDTTTRIDLFENKSYYHFLRSLLPHSSDSVETMLRKHLHASMEEIEALRWLGLFEEDWLEGYKDITPAVILQHLLEKKFTMRSDDKDCIVMRHELEYSYKNFKHKFTSTLITQGEDYLNSATAKAVGLTTGAAAKAFLMGNIKVKGLHTPTKKEIYDPILNELDDLGVAFHIEESKEWDTDVSDPVDQTVPSASSV
jgi:saccharopine dehydrogenase-like NADP-dependent oxidoreductase